MTRLLEFPVAMRSVTSRLALAHASKPHRRSQPPALLTAPSREVGVATEILLTKEEQVSDDRACAAGLRLKE